MNARNSTFTSAEGEHIDEVLEHLNGRHADSVALLAHHLGMAATEAELQAPTPTGLDVVAVDTGERCHLDFGSTVTDVATFRASVLEAVASARTAAGDDLPLTSLETESAATTRIRTHPVRVLSCKPVTAGLMAVRFGGLEAFEPAGPDVFFYALVGTDGPIDPSYTMEQYKAQGPTGPVRGAYYTVRRWDAETGVLTVWVVLHGHHDGVAGWLSRAVPGDQLLLWGPRLGFEPPAEADSLLLVADETGYAATARFVELASPDIRIEAVLETGSEDLPPLPEHPAVRYRWIRRSGPPGTGDDLLDAVAAVDLTHGCWAACGAGESRQITRIRRLLRHERGLPARRVSMTGYWRRGADGTERAR